jgi:hypothetical protein
MLSTIAVILAALLAIGFLVPGPLGSFLRLSCSWTGAGPSGKFLRRGSRTLALPGRKGRFLLLAISPGKQESARPKPGQREISSFRCG